NRRRVFAEREVVAVLARHQGAAVRRILPVATGRPGSLATRLPHRGTRTCIVNAADGAASIFLRNQNPQQDVNEDARKARRENRDQHITDSGQTGIETEVISQATDDAGEDAVAAGTTQGT